jgi:RecB family endonuclease NucS
MNVCHGDLDNFRSFRFKKQKKKKKKKKKVELDGILVKSRICHQSIVMLEMEGLQKMKYNRNFKKKSDT